MVELAVGLPFLVVLLTGMFEMGMAFYTYHKLESAVRNAARYAAVADYDSPNGTSFESAVRNLAVYGTTNPENTSDPRIANLETSNIRVEVEKDGAGIPIRVALAVTAFDVRVGWRTFRLANKPRATFEFQGQFR